MKHYHIADSNVERGFVEVSEMEFTTLMGTKEIRPYGIQVYHGKLTIEEVPEVFREAVRAMVDARNARWGEYNKQEVSTDEFQAMLEEVL